MSSARLCDAAECGHDVFAAIDTRRVSARPDQDKVVIHDLAAVYAEPVLDKRKLGGAVVDEHDIAIPAFADLESLSGPDRDHPDLDAGRLRERG